jgi:RNA polymerase sigma factor (sigma-70 family)
MFGRKKFSDEEIVEEIRGGNQQALVYLYQNNFSSVRNYILKNNGTLEDVDDILQDAVIAVWQNVSQRSFTLTSKLNTYIYAIAKNLWLKQLNKDKRLDPLEDFHSNTHPADEPKNHKMDLDIVVEYLGKLGDTCRELLQLFYFDGLDMTSIAERMDFANADTAKSKKYQCFKKLEQLIKQDFTKGDFNI